MKITIKSSKLQEQNLKNLPPLSNEQIAKIIRIFASHQSETDPSILRSDLEKMGIKADHAILYLNKDIMASNAYIKAVESHNDMIRNFDDLEGEEIQVDAFPRFPDTRNTADSKSIPDPRSYQKNLKGGISEVYLRKIIQEEIQNEKNEALKFLFRKCARVVEKYENTYFMSEISNLQEIKLLIDKIYSLGFSDSDILDKLFDFKEKKELPDIVVDRATDLFNEYTSKKDIESGDAWQNNS